MGLSRGEGEDIRKKKGLFLSGKKKGISEGKKVFFGERGMGALFRKRCLDNARGFFSRRLCCTQVVTCKVAAILIKKGLFRARFGNIFRRRKKSKKPFVAEIYQPRQKKSTEKTFPEK